MGRLFFSNSLNDILSAKKQLVIFTAEGNIENLNLSDNTYTVSVLPSDVKKVYRRSNGKGYFIISKKGIFRLDNDFKVKHRFQVGSIKSVLEIGDTIFVAQSTGLIKIVKSPDGEYSYKRNNIAYSQTINSNIAAYALASYKKEIYVGTVKGLHKYTLGDDKSQLVNFSDDLTTNQTWIQDIKIDKDEIVWLATINGLLGLKNEKLYKTYTRENGLSDNSCNYIHIDENNQIWVGTQKGINIVNSKNGNIQNVNLSNGLPSNRINSIFIEDSTVWVGTPRGLVHFKLNDLLAKKQLRSVVITNIQIDGRDTMTANRFVLKYENNDIVLDYASPYFKNQSLTYHYRLLGLKDDWQATRAKIIPYTNLPAGDYQFEIYALDEQGQRSEQNTIFNIKILKPFWQRTWFIISGVLLGIMTVSLISFLIARNYRRRREKQLNFERELAESKIRALQSQMNPHFIFNALNAIQHFFTIDSKELAMLHLNKFAKLIRLIFEYSKETTIPFYKEIEFIQLYLELEKLRFREDVIIDYKIDTNIPQDQIHIPPLLIQPMIENAFKHGLLHKKEQGNLKVEFIQNNENQIKCIIEDDGVGRKAAKKMAKKWKIRDYRSSGLNTVNERVELFNENNTDMSISVEIIDLEDYSKNALGTKVIFSFDLKKDFWSE